MSEPYFWDNKLKEAKPMRHYIARLVKCGIPRDIAVCVCKSFAWEKDWKGMERYVEAVEEESKYREDEEW